MHLLFSLYHAVAQLSFTEQSYTVHENEGMVEACVLLLGRQENFELERSIMFRVSSVEGNAIGTK